MVPLRQPQMASLAPTLRCCARRRPWGHCGGSWSSWRQMMRPPTLSVSGSRVGCLDIVCCDTDVTRLLLLLLLALLSGQAGAGGHSGHGGSLDKDETISQGIHGALRGMGGRVWIHIAIGGGARGARPLRLILKKLVAVSAQHRGQCGGGGAAGTAPASPWRHPRQA